MRPKALAKDKPKEIKEEIAKILEKDTTGRISHFVSIRTRIFNKAVKHVAGQFVASHEEICKGQHVELIQKDSALGLFDTIRKKVARDVYQSSDAEHIELAGHATRVAKFWNG